MINTLVICVICKPHKKKVHFKKKYFTTSKFEGREILLFHKILNDRLIVHYFAFKELSLSYLIPEHLYFSRV
jgi:hypothetical protein